MLWATEISAPLYGVVGGTVDKVVRLCDLRAAGGGGSSRSQAHVDVGQRAGETSSHAPGIGPVIVDAMAVHRGVPQVVQRRGVIFDGDGPLADGGGAAVAREPPATGLAVDDAVEVAAGGGRIVGLPCHEAIRQSQRERRHMLPVDWVLRCSRHVVLRNVGAQRPQRSGRSQIGVVVIRGHVGERVGATSLGEVSWLAGGQNRRRIRAVVDSMRTFVDAALLLGRAGVHDLKARIAVLVPYDGVTVQSNGLRVPIRESVPVAVRGDQRKVLLARILHRVAGHPRVDIVVLAGEVSSRSRQCPAHRRTPIGGLRVDACVEGLLLGRGEIVDRHVLCRADRIAGGDVLRDVDGRCQRDVPDAIAAVQIQKHLSDDRLHHLDAGAVVGIPV